AESQHETTTAQLVDVGRVAREQEGRSVVDTTDQRAEANALGEAREHSQACPAVPLPAGRVIADPERIEAEVLDLADPSVVRAAEDAEARADVRLGDPWVCGMSCRCSRHSAPRMGPFSTPCLFALLRFSA